MIDNEYIKLGYDFDWCLNHISLIYRGSIVIEYKYDDSVTMNTLVSNLKKLCAKHQSELRNEKWIKLDSI